MKGTRMKDEKKIVIKKNSELTSSQLLLLLFLLIITIIIYFPSLSGNFNIWDDYAYITGNPHIQLTKANIETSFIKGENHGMYLPLTSLSFSLNYYFAGLNPLSYHLINILLHLTTIILVFWFIYKLCFSFEVGLITSSLFAIHTMQVESVAFIAGRRDILYSMFFILSCICYIKYIDTSKRKFYFYALFVFILSVFAKGQAVSLPITLFALDFFRGKKIFTKKSLIEKIPFLIISIIFGIIAFNVKNITTDYRVTLDVINRIPFYERAIFASYGYLVYLLKLIIPYNLSVIYPYPLNFDKTLPPEYYLYPLLLAVALFASYYLFKKGYRNFTFGILFFSINIFLVLQLIPNSYGIINEHYVYLPSIGIFFIIASTYKWLSEHKKSSINKLFFAFTIYFIFLTISTYSRSKVWKDSITLFSDVIKKHPNDPLAYAIRGVAKNELKDYSSAIQDFEIAIKLQPNYSLAYLNRGLSFYYLKKYDTALLDLNKSIKISPENAIAYNNRGLVKNGLKDFSGAIIDLNKAISLNNEYAFAYFNRGYAYLRLFDFNNALIDFNKGISLNNSEPQAFLNRGFVKLYTKDYEGALKDFDYAIKLKPDYLDAYVNRGTIKSNFLKDYQGAINDFNEALKLSKNSPMVYFNRGVAKYKLNDFQGACFDWQRAFELGDTSAYKTIKQFCK